MVEASKKEYGEDMTVTEHAEERKTLPDHINIVSHSPLFYWWPVWALGFFMAGITWFAGESITIGNAPPEKFHFSTSLGLVFTLVLFAVLMITNITLRGIVSAVVVLGALFLAVLFAWLGWWDNIVRLIPDLSVHMNFGFYMLISTLVLVLWALTFFIFDRFTYWRVEAGQITQERLIGGGEESYDTSGIVFEEKHDDPFRHWILGFGAGDLRMSIRGAKKEEVYLPNVLFANAKITQAQALIKRKPD